MTTLAIRRSTRIRELHTQLLISIGAQPHMPLAYAAFSRQQR